jgi:hypothetical protein
VARGKTTRALELGEICGRVAQRTQDQHRLVEHADAAHPVRSLGHRVVHVAQ